MSARTQSTVLVNQRTMKAVVRETYGSAEVLQLKEIEIPQAGNGEVLIRVQAAGLDRGAWHVMMGKPYLMRLAGFGLRRPNNIKLGSEVAGVVEAVGQNVTGFKPGDRVFGTSSGSFAEYALAPASKLAHMPIKASFEQAAAVPISAQTALQALLNHGHLQAGQQVLIIGASGGVGSFAVQIAKALGAKVTGVCSTAKLDLVRSLGADAVIDYTQTDLAQLEQRFDLILDIGGSRPIAPLRRMLSEQGRLVVVGGEGGDNLTGGIGRQMGAMLGSSFSRQKVVMFICNENSQDLSTLAGLMEAGKLNSAIDRVCALGGVADAMRDLEAGRVRGKVVVKPA